MTKPIAEFPPEWRVTSAEPLADGVGGHVWRVQTADGVAIAKRLSGAARAEAAFAIAWLREQNGRGAVRLIDIRDDWQLLEDGGDRTAADLLKDEGDEAAAIVAADVLRRLHASDGPAAGLQSLADRFAALYEASDQHGGVFGEAAIIARRLTTEAAPSQPLHGDLHHDNLLSGPRGWLAIDPHGLFGDPAYDAANWLYNPVERQDLRTDPARARRLAAILAPAVRRPADIIRRWAFCHACLSAAWYLEDDDTDEAALSLEAARALRAA